MRARQSHRLVIDTSVVCSASESEESVSSACREALEAVLNICHRVVLTGTLHEEWNEHLSRYSRKWRRTMSSKRKVLDNINPKKVTINTKGLSDSDYEAVEKDRFLVEAAFAADKIIITRDESFTEALAKTPEGPQIIESITWINPVKDGIEILQRL